MTNLDWKEEGCSMRWCCCGDCSQCVHKYESEEAENADQ